MIFSHRNTDLIARELLHGGAYNHGVAAASAEQVGFPSIQKGVSHEPSHTQNDASARGNAGGHSGFRCGQPRPGQNNASRLVSAVQGDRRRLAGRRLKERRCRCRRHGGHAEGRCLRGRLRQGECCDQRADDGGHGVLAPVDDQSLHGNSLHATDRAGPPASGRRRGEVPARAGLAAGPRRICRGWNAATAAGQGRDQGAPSADAYLRLHLLDLERGSDPLRAGDEHARHRDLQERRLHRSARIRAWRAVGIRHQHGLGRQAGGSGVGPIARNLLPREHLRSARHEGFQAS